MKIEKLALVKASVKVGRRNQLALNLLHILFDPETLAESTVNGTKKRMAANNAWTLQKLRLAGVSK